MSNKRKANIKLAETKALSTIYKSLDTILVERRDRVGLITLNRPKILNALDGCRHFLYSNRPSPSRP